MMQLITSHETMEWYTQMRSLTCTVVGYSKLEKTLTLTMISRKQEPKSGKTSTVRERGPKSGQAARTLGKDTSGLEWSVCVRLPARPPDSSFLPTLTLGSSRAGSSHCRQQTWVEFSASASARASSRALQDSLIYIFLKNE